MLDEIETMLDMDAVEDNEAAFMIGFYC